VSEGSLEGRVGIVTGGTSGIGAAVVARCTELGARVAYCARSLPPGGRPGTERPGTEEFWTVDVRSWEQVERFCHAVRDRFGRIDFVVASAGLTLPGRMDDGDPDLWRSVIETNVLGTAHVLRATLPLMQEQGSGGHFVLVGSVAGRGTHAGEPVYLASKWAIVGLAAALRQELIPMSIRVSLVEPGIVDTPMMRDTPGLSQWLAAVEPLQPEDVARAIVFALVQPASISVNEVLLRPSNQVA
jgi:NADP-dependent 3-hydroxy acid dehydrogenase YdfG